MLQRIGVLASRPADLSRFRQSVERLFLELPADAQWEFRYYRALDRLQQAAARGQVQLSIILSAEPSAPRWPAHLPLLAILPYVEQNPDRSDRTCIDLAELSAANLLAGIQQAWTQAEVDRELAYLAQHDPITGLPKCEAFATQLENVLHQGSPLIGCIIAVQLQNFGEVQDGLGIATTERLLKLAAARLREQLGPRDRLARGDAPEFLVAVQGRCNRARVERIAAQLQNALVAPFELGESTAYLSAGTGAVMCANKSVEAHALVEQARRAAETARAGELKFYDGQSTRELRRGQVEAALDQALEREEFEVYYQPIVDLRHGSISGAEALLRWHGRSVGDVSPALFIPMAEQSGSIISIGDWVLRQATRDAVDWLDRFWMPVRLSINISGHQIRGGRLLEDLRRILGELPLTAAQIELELTERAYLQEVRQHAAVFEGIRNLGVRIALDDFGTGFASLSYLKQFPVDVLKIDRTLIAPLPDSAAMQGLVKAMIAMGRHLGLRMVAEGVETEAQLEFLRKTGCDEAQGFYLAHPMPGAELIATIQNHPPMVVGNENESPELQANSSNNRSM